MKKSTRFHQSVFAFLVAAGVPLAILASQYAGATFPLVPACIIAAICCFCTAALLTRSVLKLMVRYF